MTALLLVAIAIGIGLVVGLLLEEWLGAYERDRHLNEGPDNIPQDTFEDRRPSRPGDRP